MLRYAITSGNLAPAVSPEETSAQPGDARQALIARYTALAHEGIDFLLIREKHLPAGELVALCRDLVSTARASNPLTRVLVSSRPDIGIAAHLDGVHLSSHPAELTPRQVRELYRRAGLPAPFISISCHSLEDIRSARQSGASAALFGPVFGKSLAGEQVVAPAGLEALRAACAEAAPMPVFALGGVTLQNAPDCLHAGAAGIAGIRLFMQETSALECP